MCIRDSPQRSGQVDNPRDDLDEIGAVDVSEDRAQQSTDDTCVAHNGPRGPERGDSCRQKPKALKLANTPDQETGGHDDEEDAHDGEKRLQSQPPATAINDLAKNGGNGEAEHGTANGCSWACLLRGADHKENGLDTFTDDRDECERGECPYGTVADGMQHALSQAGSDRCRLALHTQCHPRQDDDRQELQTSFEGRLEAFDSCRVQDGEDTNGCRNADNRRRRCPQPYLARRPAGAQLTQVGQNDRQYDCYLYSLSQRYDERIQHVSPFPAGPEQALSKKVYICLLITK